MNGFVTSKEVTEGEESFGGGFWCAGNVIFLAVGGFLLYDVRLYFVF